ncbi:hypothetical protein B1987_28905 [Mycobacterium kansasii]|uniref:Reverse transcriptase domain-containing protein n=1 Tax=Mycobacterium attenuatum TaxID=2341086 RepID=A0A498PZN2_9MYCO|nr:reverse transcriptase domain-containing protein [Mycobacterium attenuatum]ORB82213.1 hypothetical protein B1987_28905 [Mycobacterium kansasii]VBA37743.1 hypothetical protein LAUMK136_02094 [Mycobacterium attenuatum]
MPLGLLEPYAGTTGTYGSEGAPARQRAGATRLVSPLLANVYLHRIDRVWDVREFGVLVRYADDAVVMCRSRQQAEAALARLRALLAELGLEPKAAKTRIVHLTDGGEGWISSASTIGGCALRGAPAVRASPSSPAGPRTRRCSMRATGSGS